MIFILAGTDSQYSNSNINNKTSISGYRTVIAVIGADGNLRQNM